MSGKSVYQRADEKQITQIAGAVILLVVFLGLLMWLWTWDWRWALSGIIVGFPAGYLVNEVLRFVKETHQ